MKKIIDGLLFDIVPVEQGFCYACKDLTPMGEVRAKFLGYDAAAEKAVPLTKWVYVQFKFGEAGREITSQIRDFIFCDTAVLANKSRIVIYPTGKMFVFNQTGTQLKCENVMYNNEHLQGIAVDGKTFWSVVPELNAVVNYSPDDRRVLMRIGGGKSTAFNKPVSLTKIGTTLYICNEKSNMVRSIELTNYAVSDFLTFQEPVYKYFMADGKEFVQLESGLYML